MRQNPKARVDRTWSSQGKGTKILSQSFLELRGLAADDNVLKLENWRQWKMWRNSEERKQRGYLLIGFLRRLALTLVTSLISSSTRFHFHDDTHSLWYNDDKRILWHNEEGACLIRPHTECPSLYNGAEIDFNILPESYGPHRDIKRSRGVISIVEM